MELLTILALFLLPTVIIVVLNYYTVQTYEKNGKRAYLIVAFAATHARSKIKNHNIKNLKMVVKDILIYESVRAVVTVTIVFLLINLIKNPIIIIFLFGGIIGAIYSFKMRYAADYICEIIVTIVLALMSYGMFMWVTTLDVLLLVPLSLVVSFVQLSVIEALRFNFWLNCKKLLDQVGLINEFDRMSSLNEGSFTLK